MLRCQDDQLVGPSFIIGVLVATVCTTLQMKWSSYKIYSKYMEVVYLCDENEHEYQPKILL